VVTDTSPDLAIFNRVTIPGTTNNVPAFDLSSFCHGLLALTITPDFE